MKPKIPTWKWRLRFQNPLWNVVLFSVLPWSLSDFFAFEHDHADQGNICTRNSIVFCIRVMPFTQTRPEFCCHFAYLVALSPTQFSAKLWENNQTINWILVTNTAARTHQYWNSEKNQHPCQLGSLRIMLHGVRPFVAHLPKCLPIPPPLRPSSSKSFLWLFAVLPRIHSTPYTLFRVPGWVCGWEGVWVLCIERFARLRVYAAVVPGGRSLEIPPGSSKSHHPRLRCSRRVPFIGLYHAQQGNLPKLQPQSPHFFQRCIYPTAYLRSIVFEFVK